MLAGERTHDAPAVLLYEARARRWFATVQLSRAAWSLGQYGAAAACWVSLEVEGGSGRWVLLDSWSKAVRMKKKKQRK
ncbi:hypothetical protein SESBI_37425 [Sesbania bispinosa]|nr:hypothetical protein SESBI_37425 [Sesbania bispinosa]